LHKDALDGFLVPKQATEHQSEIERIKSELNGEEQIEKGEKKEKKQIER
jgi:hypothetical protein